MATYPTQTLNTHQLINLTSSPVDANGKPDQPTGEAWSLSPTGIVGIVSTGTNAGQIQPIAPGTTVATLTGSTGGGSLSESVTIVVTPDPAVTFGLVFSAPIG